MYFSQDQSLRLTPSVEHWYRNSGSGSLEPYQERHIFFVMTYIDKQISKHVVQRPETPDSCENQQVACEKEAFIGKYRNAYNVD